MVRFIRSGRRLLQVLGPQRVRSSLMGGGGPGCVPIQAPLSVRMRALRRFDNRFGLRLWTSLEGLTVAALDSDVPTNLTEMLTNLIGLRTFKYWDLGMEIVRDTE